jgi:hypothetical protein
MKVLTYTTPHAPPLYAVCTDGADWTPIPGYAYSTEMEANRVAGLLDYADSGARGAQGSSTLGGYPLIALTGDDSVICSICAHNDRRRYLPTAGTPLDNYDRKEALRDLHVHWEGRPIGCDNCNREIESAYGPTPDEIAEDAAEQEDAQCI